MSWGVSENICKAMAQKDGINVIIYLISAAACLLGGPGSTCHLSPSATMYLCFIARGTEGVAGVKAEGVSLRKKTGGVGSVA